MKIEQDAMTIPPLPADITEAELAAEECLRLTGTLLMLVEESQSDAATSLGEWRDQLSRDGTETLVRLLAAVQRLEKVDDSRRGELARPRREPPHENYRNGRRQTTKAA